MQRKARPDDAQAGAKGNAQKMRKILVIQQKMIGDVLASTVICRAVKEKFPHAEVHYLVHPSTQPVVVFNPYIDKIVLFPTQIKGFNGLKKYGQTLQKEHYDAVIDAYGKWESILPAYFSKAKIRIGFRKWYTSPFYTKTVIPAENVAGSAIHHRLQLAEALTGEFSNISFPEIFLGDDESVEAQATVSALPGSGKIIMISVLGSGTNKSLPAAQMAEMLDIMANFDVRLLFNYMPSQEQEAAEIYRLCEEKTQQKIIFNFKMTALRDFITVLSKCDALVGNEGGAVNMAKALRIPTFTVFSPWINKSSWDMLTDTGMHEAVHLMDYEPEIYKGIHPKKLRKQAIELYSRLKPELFRQKLEDFMTGING
ncbi:MAG: lipopolysaccharide heptosyltransferase family protein [Flavobacterium sp.]|nr:MAG: lipopolysaccharide heptosyltransferase family protein [Flavobacterium sp.]